MNFEKSQISVRSSTTWGETKKMKIMMRQQNEDGILENVIDYSTTGSKSLYDSLYMTSA